MSKNRRVKSVLKEKKIIELKKSHSSEIKVCSSEMDHTSEWQTTKQSIDVFFCLTYKSHIEESIPVKCVFARMRYL